MHATSPDEQTTDQNPRGAADQRPEPCRVRAKHTGRLRPAPRSDATEPFAENLDYSALTEGPDRKHCEIDFSANT
ncbi:hypothetical protein IFM12276_36030 [Nocardia sputorum]|uniref:Uncharacterized protein n=1 Tax=Nocardia sputorum TaxID=2984338 RepID=A0ABM8CZT8_9NOCA|nr:hypothetical protein IFM12276_36030 [Nocardia sputorum]